jgi:lipopolysaccharide/colanic/teichoic acid biosynthesis glycosyltransferase
MLANPKRLPAPPRGPAAAPAGPPSLAYALTERDLKALESPEVAPGRPWYVGARAALDAAAAAVLLVLTAPVVLAAMLLVRLTSPGPALYTQVRLGRGGKPFRIIKVRTMVDNCEALTGPRWCVPGDPRVTPLGQILRVLHIDELPQLINVIRGEMALIGPRPERPEIAADLKTTIDNFDARLAVRPGITGFAQVQLPADTEVEGVRGKLALDLIYIRRMGPWLDLKIAACTLLKMLGLGFETSRRLLRAETVADAPRVFENAPPEMRPARPLRKVA